MATKTHAKKRPASVKVPAKVKAPGFFKSIPSSIYSPSFYAGVASRSFWRGFWYFAGFTALLLLVWTACIVVIPYFTNATKINETIEKVLHFYPEELVITVQDGKVSTNMEEPYFISLNDVLPIEGWDDRYQIVIDTTTPFSMEQLLGYKAIAWLTVDAIYIQGGENSQPEIIPLAEAPDTVINKQVADTSMDTIWQKTKSFIPAVGVVTLIFAFLGILFFRMLYLLIFSLALRIIFSIMKLPYDYGTAYKMGFYAMTLSLLVTLAMAIQPWLPELHPFFLMPTLISLIVVTVNLDRAKKAGLIK
ncbi:MAG: DUF1189 family protein [Candidatus Gracilibacteria bacterium]